MTPEEIAALQKERQRAIELAARFWASLKRIASYQSPERLRRRAERDYGLCAEEVIEMAYENVILEAKATLKGAPVRTLLQQRTP